MVKKGLIPLTNGKLPFQRQARGDFPSRFVRNPDVDENGRD
jgi:hypothetical protein